MLDIRFIRENADLVQEKSKQKGYDVDIRALLEADKNYIAKEQEVNELRTLKNQQNHGLSEAPSAEQVVEGKELRQKIDEAEKAKIKYFFKRQELLRAVPNMPIYEGEYKVPVGASEDENVFGELKGKKLEFDFKPKTHWEITEARGIIDKKRAAKVAGSRFAYIKGDLVRLQFALIQFVIDTLTNKETLEKIIQDAGLKDASSNPFVPVLPPLMIRTEVFEAMDRLEPRDERYKVGSDEDNLWLQGSAEHTLGPMYMNETLSFDDMPIRLLGYATSFRREAGTYGKDTEGIIRMHQFDKLEMESFSTPSNGLNEHLFLIAIQEYFLTTLGIPYRVVQKCTADIGKPNARGIDMEAWLPGADRFMETHTADYMTNYQALDLQTRVFIPAVEISGGVQPELANQAGSKFVHTNDATAFALGRTMVAIIENFQTAEGTVKIPEALQKYMSGQTEI